jgi:hypothetical protein
MASRSHAAHAHRRHISPARETLDQTTESVPEPEFHPSPTRRACGCQVFWPGTYVRTPDQDRVQRLAMCIELPR